MFRFHLSPIGSSVPAIYVALLCLIPLPASAQNSGILDKWLTKKKSKTTAAAASASHPATVSIIDDLRPSEASPTLRDSLSLEQCIEIALRENRKRPASLAAVAMAESQHKQALSAYWPQFTLTASAMLRSDDPNFIFPAQDFLLPETTVNVPETSIGIPAMSVPLPATNLQLPGGSINIPAGVLGPNAVQLPVSPQQIAITGQAIQVPASTFNVPAQQFTVPPQTFHLPEQNITLLDRFTYGGGVEMEYPLYTGGLRGSLRKQAKDGIRAAEENVRRTDLEIVHDVRRMYQGAVLAGELEDLGRETLKRMEATLELTEKLYEGDSLQVKKTDYLRNKVLVENIRTLVERLLQNRLLAESALTHSMGLSWRSEVTPSASEVTYHPTHLSLEALVAQAYRFSPDWRSLRIGLDAAEQHIVEKKSGRLPKIALVGNIHTYQNNLGTGLDTSRNLNAWQIGVGLELPLFRGFRTRHEVAEARAKLDELQQNEVLLEEGIAMQIKVLLIKLTSLQRQEKTSTVAVESAIENRDLTERAYQNDLVEPDDVFISQLFEATSKAKHLKTRYDHTEARSALDTVIGINVTSQLGLASK